MVLNFYMIKLIFLEKLKDSDDFREIQQLVDIIDEDYKKKWIQTAFEERIEFYKNSSIKDIFEKLKNLRNPIGYTLV